MNFFKSHLISYIVPKNLNCLWNFGFLLAVTYVLQVVSGILLTFKFKIGERLSFTSLRDICTEENFGWLVRFIHSNGVSVYFVIMFLHVVKGLLYSTKFLQPSWYTGVLILLLSIAIAFIGYVLPEGQMSYWGSIVIANLMKWSGSFCTLIFGGETIGESTYKRFMIYHYTFPFILGLIIALHIYYLHRDSSSHPLSFADIKKGFKFFWDELWNDFKNLFVLLVLVAVQLGFGLVKLFQADPDNSLIANSVLTPHHIVPEWYLLLFYSTLKVLPTKVSGLLAIAAVVKLIIVLAESRFVSPLLSSINYHRCWSTIGNIFVSIIFILGCVGHMIVNTGLALFGLMMLYISNTFVVKMLDTARVRS